MSGRLAVLDPVEGLAIGGGEGRAVAGVPEEHTEYRLAVRRRDTRGPWSARGMPAPASGFNLLDGADVDEAIEVSAKHPIARFGVVELRPLAEG